MFKLYVYYVTSLNPSKAHTVDHANNLPGKMEESFNRFEENSLNHCQNVTTKLMFLAKDVIPEAVREKMKQGQVRSALETNVVSLWTDGKDPPFGFIKEWLLMKGEELLNIRGIDMFSEHCHVDSVGISEKRYV